MVIKRSAEAIVRNTPLDITFNLSKSKAFGLVFSGNK